VALLVQLIEWKEVMLEKFTPIQSEIAQRPHLLRLGALFSGTVLVQIDEEERWSRKFDQFAAVLSYSIGFISGGNLRVRRSSIIGLVRRHDPM
jgi:hypothetical protein